MTTSMRNTTDGSLMNRWRRRSVCMYSNQCRGSICVIGNQCCSGSNGAGVHRWVSRVQAFRSLLSVWYESLSRVAVAL